MDLVTGTGFVGFVVLGVIAGILCYFAFERHTMTVRRWLKARLLPLPGKPA